MNWENKKILIVDDDEGSYVLAKNILSDSGASFTWAKNGYEALQIINDEQFNMVIMDLKMPELDGIETTKLIKDRLPDLPIIVQTAFAFDTEKQRAIDAGCDGYLTKPIDFDEFIEQMEGLMS